MSRLDRAWAPDGEVVVVRAANRWDEVRMADHQLASALSDHVPVLYVDPCSSVVTRVRVAGWPAAGSGGGRISQVSEHVVRLSPEGLPGIRRPKILRTNRHLVAVQVRHALRRLGVRATAVLEANLLTPTIDLVPAGRRVYWAQDDFVGMAPLIGVDEGVVADAERLVADRSELVIAANPTVADRLRGEGHRVELIPFGCDAELFTAAASATPSPLVTLPRPIAVLMGTVNDRIDPDILDAVAGTGISLVVIGPLGAPFDPARFHALVSRPNVIWLGPRDFTDLPAFLAAADVGLVPYTHSRFNEGSFPLKTLEYLAAGLPVVATDLPAIRWLATREVHIADDPATFARAVLEVASRPAADRAVARLEFARGHSWQRRAEAFADALEGVEGRLSRPVP
jgi:glycosyltransferase involved in cell wall biosynthesis